MLRLQTQALKKLKIQQCQAAAEKMASTESEAQIRQNTDFSDETVSNIEKRLADNKVLKSPSVKDLNIGILEESQTHLRPVEVDTSLVHGRIIQVRCQRITKREAVLRGS